MMTYGIILRVELLYHTQKGDNYHIISDVEVDFSLGAVDFCHSYHRILLNVNMYVSTLWIQSI